MPSIQQIVHQGASALLYASPLTAWAAWKQWPSTAILAPLCLAALMEGIGLLCGQSFRQIFSPVQAALRFALIAGLVFTAACLTAQVTMMQLPAILVNEGCLPPAWLVLLGHLNMLAHLGSLILLTLAVLFYLWRMMMPQRRTQQFISKD